MKKSGYLIGGIALAVLSLGPSGAADFSQEAIGTTGSDFLSMDIGARGVALGGAYTAVTRDVYSLYWNPAGLTKIPRFSAGFMYSKYIQSIAFQSLAAAHRINDTSVIAGGLRYRDIGSIDHTDPSGKNLGAFHPRDYVVEAAWGQSIYDLSDSDIDVTMGIAGRWLYSDYLLHADGYAGDIGIQTRFYNGPFPHDMAFVAQNIGRGQKFDQVRETVPFRARFGGAIYPWKSLMLATDAVLPIDNNPYAALGGEYTYQIDRNLKGALRVGFNSQTIESLGPLSAPSAGFGVTLGEITFDYAFVPLGLLNQVHRFSLSYNLPPKASRRYHQR